MLVFLATLSFVALTSQNVLASRQFSEKYYQD